MVGRGVECPRVRRCECGCGAETDIPVLYEMRGNRGEASALHSRAVSAWSSFNPCVRRLSCSRAGVGIWPPRAVVPLSIATRSSRCKLASLRWMSQGQQVGCGINLSLTCDHKYRIRGRVPRAWRSTSSPKRALGLYAVYARAAS